jgi:glutaredoxin
MSFKSNYYFYSVLLDGCYYSNLAAKLLEKHDIKNKIQVVNSENKEKFKLENYKTFPQIFLKKEGSNESLFLGGYTDLDHFIKTFKNKKFNDQNIENFTRKYNWWSKKAILRSIELIN